MAPSTRRLLLLGFAALLLPLAAGAAATAAPGTRELVLDFQSPGPMRDLLGKSLGVAKSFLFLAAFLGYALEAFGRSPTAERDFAAVTWRLVAVLFLLWNYQAIFGSVIGLVDRIEREVAPPSTWARLREEMARSQASLEALSSRGERASVADVGGAAGGSGGTTAKPSLFTSWVYEALVAVLQLLGEGLVFLIRWMSRILTATLFILGPLALVAGIPRVSSTGARWFLRFVTIASWPIFANVLLAVMVALGGQGTLHGSYLEALVASLVLLVTALSTPTLASHVVGGALHNFAASGYGSARSAHREGVAPAARTVVAVGGGVKGMTVAAASSVAGLLTRGSSGEGGGSGGGGGRQGSGGSGGREGGQGGGVVANPPGGGPERGRGARRGGGQQGGAPRNPPGKGPGAR